MQLFDINNGRRATRRGEAIQGQLYIAEKQEEKRKKSKEFFLAASAPKKRATFLGSELFFIYRYRGKEREWVVVGDGWGE